MAESKTRATAIEPSDFIAAVQPVQKRQEAEVLNALFRRATKTAPQMWGPTIVGYGSYDYRYESGHAGTACRVGFSPRKAKHSLYLAAGDGVDEAAAFDTLLARLGKHTRGASCIYVNKLADIDLGVLEEMVAAAWRSTPTGAIES